MAFQNATKTQPNARIMLVSSMSALAKMVLKRISTRNMPAKKYYPNFPPKFPTKFRTKEKNVIVSLLIRIAVKIGALNMGII